MKNRKGILIYFICICWLMGACGKAGSGAESGWDDYVKVESQVVEGLELESLQEESKNQEGASGAEGVVSEQVPEVEPYQYLNTQGMTLESRIHVPEGYERTSAEAGSLTEFLRTYPLKVHDSAVLLYDGSEKWNQDAHVAVFQLPIEERDLQQCADSVMRVYAEYYFQTEQYEKIRFHFTNGFLAEYGKWRDGYRISVEGNNASWVKSASYDDSYETFVKFMRMVFTYAGTLSMEQESTQISVKEARVGDCLKRRQSRPCGNDSGYV